MWIESHQELARHPKTRKLARLLGAGVPCVIGHLHLLWWWAVDYAPDGRLGRFTAEDIADAVLWDGDPQVLWDALLETRWLDAGTEGAEIHNWPVYQGRLMEQRRLRSQRGMRNRTLYADMELVHAVRERDGDTCRYCGQPVDWKDRKGGKGGTYDHIDPEAGNTVDNVVVACRSCNSGKGRRTPDQAGIKLLSAGICRESAENLPTVHNSTVHNSTGEDHTPLAASQPSPTGEKRRTNKPKAEVEFTPDERSVIDGLLEIVPQLEGSPQFWRKLLDRYMDLDLEAEFVKMADWLGRHRKRQCTAVFVLNWLAKAAEHVSGSSAEAVPLIACAGCGATNRPVAQEGDRCSWCQSRLAVSA